MSTTVVRVYAPPPGRSVRPPDLEPSERQAVRASDPQRHRPGVWRRIAEFPLLILVALVLAYVIKTFLVQAFYIPSGSMIDSLAINDRVLVEKVSYRFRDPDRGEIIVFERPGRVDVRDGVSGFVRSFFEGLGVVPPDEEIDLIKRVVGLPGETIEIIDGVVHVDGTAIEEPYAAIDGRDFDPVEVPEGHYYMLGDNRSNSDDSRWGLGTVPRDQVVGRAFLILWPPSRATFALDHTYPELLSSSVGATGPTYHAPLRGHALLRGTHAHAGGTTP